MERFGDLSHGLLSSGERFWLRDRNGSSQPTRYPVPAPQVEAVGKGAQPVGWLAAGARMGVALMTRPSLLLLDEPTAGLSPTAADEVFELVQDLARSGLAVPMVEQNALLALEYETKGRVLRRRAKSPGGNCLLARRRRGGSVSYGRQMRDAPASL